MTQTEADTGEVGSVDNVEVASMIQGILYEAGVAKIQVHDERTADTGTSTCEEKSEKHRQEEETTSSDSEDASDSSSCASSIAVGPPALLEPAAGQEGFFQEFWAGFGGLTAEVAKTQIKTLAPIEAFPKSGYRREHDLSLPSVKATILKKARAGLYFWAHFGIPCKTWGTLAYIDLSLIHI